MRYKPWPRHAFKDSTRKRAAIRRRQQNERDALPLFADEIAKRQPDEAQVVAMQKQRWTESETLGRKRRADEWRQARRTIQSMPPKMRKDVIRVWNCAPYPADPSRLLGMLRSFALGKLDLNRPPFPMCKTDAGGARLGDLFAKPELFVNILEARRIADAPDDYPMRKRHAAYHHLQSAATNNRDKKRAMADRVLACNLFLRLADPKHPKADQSQEMSNDR